MTKDKTSIEAPGPSRRGILGAGAAMPVVLAGAAASATEPMPVMDMAIHGGPDVKSDPIANIEALEVLTAIEMEALEAFCARLIPTDALGPGAKEARAAHYIDRALGGALATYRDAYAAGLSALDAHARSAEGKPFARLAATDQDAMLHDLEAGRLDGFTPDSAAFFSLVRAHTIEGTFSDPYYGGNANFIGWDLIGYPGVRMPVRPEDQRLTTPKPVRQSAYGSGMFARARRG